MEITPLHSLQRQFSAQVQSEDNDPNERMAVYQNAYFMRMLESLEEDFPKAHTMLGDVQFTRLVREFLKHIPSRYWTLAEVSEQLPEFILRTHWNTEFPALLNTTRLEWLAILADMSLADTAFHFSMLSTMTPEQQQKVVLCLGPLAGVAPMELSEAHWCLLKKISRKISIGDLVAEMSDLNPADITKLFSEWVSEGVVAKWTQ